MSQTHPDRHSFALVAALLLQGWLLVGCGSGGGPAGPSDPGNDDPPVVTNPDSTGATVSSQGGLVALEDGTGVYVPPGAVPGSAQITIVRKDPSTWVDGTGATQQALVSAKATVSQFAAKVEIRVPLPAGMTEGDSARVSAGYVDETTGAIQVVPARVKTIDGKPFLVVETDHFTDWFTEWLVGPTPPASAGPLAVPYYNQGASNYCWATSVHMVTQAAHFDDGAIIPDIIGRMGVDEGGISDFTFRFSPTLASLVRTRTGVSPTRKIWDYVNAGLVRDELMREIGLNGRPVALFNASWNHAVVVVGYSDRNTYIIHDPQSTTNGAIGYSTRTWSEISKDMALSDKLVTLVVPKAPESVDGPLRVSFLPQAMRFIKPSGGTGDPSAVYQYRWDHTRPSGYSFRHISSDEVGDPLPGAVATLQINGDAQLSNSSRSEAKEATVWLEVIPMGAPSGSNRYSVSQDVQVPANAVLNVNPDDVPVDEFRYNKATPTEYLLSMRTTVNGSTVDTHRLRFTIASVTPELTSVEPSTGLVGSTVVILGKGFGQLAKGNKVTFNGVEAKEILLWSDTQITVKVPSGATTGPLVVARGEVPSNSLEFTVPDYVTSQTFDLAWGHADTGFRFSTTVQIDALTAGAGWRTVFQDRSVFDPEAWVTLWFGTTEQAAGGSQQFQVSVTVNSVTTTNPAYNGTITVDDFDWVVRSQTADGLPTSHVLSNPVTITEAESPFSKQADLYIKLIITPTNGGSPRTVYTSPGLGLSFHPGHTGMVNTAGGGA